MYHLDKLLIATVATTTLVFWFASPAWAETIYDAAATGEGGNGSAHHAISETFLIAMGVNNYDTIETNDPQNPMNGAAGTCFGLLEMKNDAWSGQGYCIMTDASGDQYNVSWNPNGQSLEYSWNLIGGSGKWVGASCGGIVRQTYHDDNQNFV